MERGVWSEEMINPGRGARRHWVIILSISKISYHPFRGSSFYYVSTPRSIYMPAGIPFHRGLTPDIAAATKILLTTRKSYATYARTVPLVLS